jgi:hypothetical protein
MPHIPFPRTMPLRSELAGMETNCAIAGSIVGLAVGPAGIPQAWIESRERLMV